MFKILLDKYQKVKGRNSDFYLNFELNSNQQLLPYNDILKIINEYEVFNEERNLSKKYRIIISINELMSNCLFDRNGNDNIIDYLLQKNHNEREYYYNQIKEIDGWFGYYNLDFTSNNYLDFIYLSPQPQKLTFLNDESDNWDITLTYPYKLEENHYLIKDGLLIVGKSETVINQKKYLVLQTVLKHNLRKGDIIQLKNTNIDGEYVVEGIGDGKNNYLDYCFYIEYKNFNEIIPNSNFRFVRKVNGIPSKYYLRKFKLFHINYDKRKVGFSKNIFNDNIFQIIFDTLDISSYKDYFKRPLSEIYLTIIKKQDYNNVLTYDSIKSGIYIPYFETQDLQSYLSFTKIPNICQITDLNGSHDYIETNLSVNADEFCGDFVEFNEESLKEYIIGDIYHRFNSISRNNESGIYQNVNIGPRPEGYYYKAHYKIQLRKFNNFITQSSSEIQTIPPYAIHLGNNIYMWRDLDPIGCDDDQDINYPFVNGCHYIYKNNIFYLRRQDPFGYYNLRFDEFPGDVKGAKINITDIKTNNTTEIC